MKRRDTFLLAVLLPAAFMQGPRGGVSSIPPGPPFDPAKHVNPVITYVEIKDFKPSTYKDAEAATDIQLMGLSKDTGSLESFELAQPSADPSKDLKLNVKATFYPVVKQTFSIVDDGQLLLFSFRPPKLLRPDMSRPPFGVSGKGRTSLRERRFGDVEPDEIEVRGHPGFIFENKDGSRTVAWLEDSVAYTATSRLARKDLLRVLDDLL